MCVQIVHRCREPRPPRRSRRPRRPAAAAAPASGTGAGSRPAVGTAGRTAPRYGLTNGFPVGAGRKPARTAGDHGPRGRGRDERPGGGAAGRGPGRQTRSRWPASRVCGYRGYGGSRCRGGGGPAVGGAGAGSGAATGSVTVGATDPLTAVFNAAVDRPVRSPGPGVRVARNWSCRADCRCRKPSWTAVSCAIWSRIVAAAAFAGRTRPAGPGDGTGRAGRAGTPAGR